MTPKQIREQALHKLNPYRSVEERFWAKVDIKEDGDCWAWLGAANKYGHARDGSKVVNAHKMAYSLVNGAPENLVLHHCDNALCCNPKHLYDGTYSDNIKDAVNRGRHFTPWRKK
jgi:hypothetical protein